MDEARRRTLVSSSEGRILLTGVFLWGLYLLVILLCGFVAPEIYKLLTAVTFSHLLVGRVAGITVGFAMDASAAAVIGINMLIETLLVLSIYPLFVMSWNRLHDIGRFEAWIAKARSSAERYRPKIQRYGVIGLFAFVWFPFWMTGPVVGSMVGYLMGFSHRRTLAVVLAGTLVAIACWAWFLETLKNWALQIHPQASWLIVGLAVLLVAAGLGFRAVKKR